MNRTLVMSRQITLGEIAKLIGGKLVGDPSAKVNSIKGLGAATENDISFFADTRFIEDLSKTSAGCIIVDEHLESLVPGNKIIVKDSNQAVIKLCNQLFNRTEKPEGISQHAFIDDTAKIGDGCYIGPACVIGRNVTVGNGSVIHPGTYIGDSSHIGRNALIYPNVTIYHDIKIGDNVIIHSGTVIGSDGFGFTRDTKEKIPQIGTVEIGNNVEIGSNVSIDRARLDSTVIGDGTKIDNLCHIAHNVRIGKNCLILACLGTAGGVIIEDNVIIGGQVGIGEKVRIGKNSIVMHQSGVTKNVKENMVVAGTPAVERIRHHKTLAYLNKLVREMENNKSP